MRNRLFPATVLVAVLTTACSMDKYCPSPEVPLPEKISPYQSRLDSLASADMRWWNVYADTILRNLIQKTLTNNRDMHVAVSKIRQMRYNMHSALDDHLPEIDLTLGNHDERKHGRNEPWDIENVTEFKGRFSWRYNLFGAETWASRQAEEEFLASVEGQRTLQMHLIAEVSTAYFELIALDRQLELVKKTMETWRESMEKAELRYKTGLFKETAYRQAVVEYKASTVQIPQYEKLIALKENQISLLAGELPSRVDRDDTLTFSQNFLNQMPNGLPSELLLRRPDVRQARAELAASKAQAGFMFADRFPSLSLSWQGGFEGDPIKDLFVSPYLYASGYLVNAIFAFGKKHHRYKASLESYLQERASYEHKVLEVFKEASDAMVSYVKTAEASLLLLDLQNATQEYVGLAQKQYMNGGLDYMDVLDSRRKLFSVQQQLAQSLCNQYLALINLYMAFGGGWSEEFPQEALSKKQLKKQEKLVEEKLSDSTFNAQEGLSREETARREYRRAVGEDITRRNGKKIKADLEPKETKKPKE